MHGGDTSPMSIHFQQTGHGKIKAAQKALAQKISSWCLQHLAIKQENINVTHVCWWLSFSIHSFFRWTFFPEESSPWPQPHCTNPTNLCMTTGAYCSISRSLAPQKVPGRPRFIEFVNHFFQTKNQRKPPEQLNTGSGNVWHTNGEEETCFGLKDKRKWRLAHWKLSVKAGWDMNATSNRWCQVAFLTANQTTSVIAANLALLRLAPAKQKAASCILHHHVSSSGGCITKLTYVNQSDRTRALNLYELSSNFVPPVMTHLLQ